MRSSGPSERWADNPVMISTVKKRNIAELFFIGLGREIKMVAIWGGIWENAIFHCNWKDATCCLLKGIEDEMRSSGLSERRAYDLPSLEKNQCWIVFYRTGERDQNGCNMRRDLRECHLRLSLEGCNLLFTERNCRWDEEQWAFWA